MTTGGALSKAFDGTDYEVAGTGVRSQSNSFIGWIGKDWGAGVTKKINRLNQNSVFEMKN